MKCKGIFRKPIFWVTFSVASLGLGFFSFKYFSAAHSILNLQIKMTRQECMQKAKEIAQKYNLGPKNFDQCVHFNSDSNVQNYVELNLGGSEAFAKLIEEKIYYPYTWQVRHFQESEVNETTIIFTPEGQKYGFSEKISEDETGLALSTKDAQNKVENFLIKDWQIDLKSYKLIESSSDKKQNGRIDYQFVYERTDKKLGQANYRLAIDLAGDKITGVHHYIDIPEQFFREFNQARSTNEMIQSSANAFIYIVYIFIGCCLGLFYLLRRHWLITKKSLILGTIIAFTEIITQLNEFSFLWLSYSTALSSKIYILQFILRLITSFLVSTIFYSLIVSVAEGLTRKAFGYQIQFWKIWNSSVASSKTMLGKTLTSYLLLGFLFSFVILFYIIVTKYFGWWMPSCTLSDPNILSNYMPGLSALAQSFKAGVWEECLFRAIPLAIGALIGQKIGYRKTGIAFGFILQAIVFGAAHASYPTLPGYARLIELIIPSFSFAGLYLAFGLFPSIILHFMFDAILFALPIFVCQSPTMFVEKIIVVVGIFLPLIVIAINWLKNKKWTETPQEAYNNAWIAHSDNLLSEIDEQKDQLDKEINNNIFQFNKTKIFVIALCTLVCFALWFKLGNFKSDVDSIKITKEEAIEKAQEILKDKKIILDNNWKILSGIDTNETNTSNFIWKNGGKALFDKFKATYLEQPEWHIRFARFVGNQKERAEQFHIYLDSNGNLTRFIHYLPDSQKGDILKEDQAKTIALDAVTKFYGIKSDQLKQLAAVSIKKFERQDWDFTFVDSNVILPNKSEAHITVSISGNEVSDMARYIHLPEQWTRNQQQKNQVHKLFLLLKKFLEYIILAIAGIQFLLAWYRRTLPTASAIVVGIGYAILSIFLRILNFPDTIIYFSTSKSIFSQILSTEFSNLISIAVSSIIITLFAGLVLKKKYSARICSGYKGLMVSVCSGIIFVGLFAPVYYLVHFLRPNIPSFIGANSYFTILAFSLATILIYIKQAFTVTYLVNSAKNRFNFLSLFYMLIMALLFMPDIVMSTEQWFFLPLNFVIITILYYFLFRYDTLLIPTTLAVCQGFQLFIHAYNNPYPGSIACALLSIMLLSLITLGLVKFLKNKDFVLDYFEGKIKSILDYIFIN